MKVINFLGDRLGSGGIESFLVNVTKDMQEDNIDPIILTNYRTESIYEKGFEQNGVEMIALSHTKKSYLHKMKRFTSYMKKQKESILHIHASSAGMYTYALWAKLAGIKRIIYHVHSTSSLYESRKTVLKNRILKETLSWCPNINIACSNAAGIDIFGKRPFKVIFNGIDIDRFAFNINARKRIRAELGLDNKYIIGQIGRFSPEKNQIFTLELINKMSVKHTNIHLILIGEGEDKEKLILYVRENKLEKHVTIIEPVVNIEDYYCAFDLFVFPSKWEGFGIVALEAQLSGLPSLYSENIIDEVVMLDSTKKIALKDKGSWISEIEKEIYSYNHDYKRAKNSQMAEIKCKKKKYISNSTHQALINLYSELT